MSIPYAGPEYQKEAYNCPHCGAYAVQNWYYARQWIGTYGSPLAIALCSRCHQMSLWIEDQLVYPMMGTAPLPNDDLSEDVKRDYNEARAICLSSPRGAAALLRLAIQKMCKELGEKGEDLNTDIANLVKNGLPIPIQQALDVVRVIGNEAVHPGQIDLNDEPDTVQHLFNLVNLIADNRISQPKRVKALFEKLPASKKEQILKRDQKKT
jgi:hypothetical protein